MNMMRILKRPKKVKQRGDLIAVYNFFIRGSAGAGTDLVSLVPSGRTRGHEAGSGEV